MDDFKQKMQDEYERVKREEAYHFNEWQRLFDLKMKMIDARLDNVILETEILKEKEKSNG